ncbi:MAG: hydroxyacid dehydrogenase [Candidatus Bathyarchaeota archaeon]|nr:MAG: hydroxyacid dehydrogenase [Candidatus Bathyarchaeota archaeon]
MVARILVCDPVHEEGVKMLRESGYEVDLETSITGEALVGKVGDYAAIVVRSRTKVTREVLQGGEKLKVVARAGVGLDNVDLEAAKELGVQVVNSPEAPTNAVAELVLGMMLSLARRIPEADASMKRGEWIKRQLTGFELSGKILGVLGFGRIGYTLAKKAKALGMKVVTFDVVIDKLMKFVEEAGAKAVSLEELLASSDFVSIHVPLLPQTRNMIGREQFGLMKEGAYIINAARGGIVDEDAIREALVGGRLGGAALDVYEEEPPGDTSLVGLENVVCTPHIGAATVEAQRANSTVVAEKLIKILSEA